MLLPLDKKAHPEGCAEKVFPRKVATLTETHRGLEGNTFYQGNFPPVSKFIQLVSHKYFTTYPTKSKDKKKVPNFYKIKDIYQNGRCPKIFNFNYPK